MIENMNSSNPTRPPQLLSAKSIEYQNLVAKRKHCNKCEGLLNPSSVEDGIFDSSEIGPWSLWQGNIDSKLMIIGQDWGDTEYFSSNQGFDGLENPTNNKLLSLLKSIGISVEPPVRGLKGKTLFFTNAILCLKEGGLQAKVKKEWFDNCGTLFLKPLIEIINPKIIITLGQRPYETLKKAFGKGILQFRRAVEKTDGFLLKDNMRLFPMYHCGKRILNSHRKYEQQFVDWERVSPFL